MQEIKEIDINDLVLWSENPRDPFGKKADNQAIATRAISTDGRSRWSLKKLLKDMGDWYDKSEIPTVIYDGNRPIVFDGNRRVLIGKIIHGCVKVETDIDFSEFDFPKKVPCNVCDKKTAIENIRRKHTKSGSWKALERDVFTHRYLKEEKSFFMALEEQTGIISNHPLMNQDFVKEELFSDSTLKKLGISVKDGTLHTPYTSKEFKDIFWKIIDLVEDKDITTRKNRGQLIPLLKKNTQIKSIISKRKGSKTQPLLALKFIRLTRRTKPKKIPLFGKKLHLTAGTVNDLYRDLIDVYTEANRGKYSPHFPMIIRMGLRLICHVSMEEWITELREKKKLYKKKIDLEDYIEKHFDDAKQQLPNDHDFLHTHGVNKNSMVDLLNMGAHGKIANVSKDQTIALSLIIGRILEKTHGTDT